MWTSVQASRIVGFSYYPYEEHATFCSHPSHSMSLSLATEKISRKYCPGKADPEHPHGPTKDCNKEEASAVLMTSEAPQAEPGTYERTRAWVISNLQTTKIGTLKAASGVVVSENDAGDPRFALASEHISWGADIYVDSDAASSKRDGETDDEGTMEIGSISSSLARSLASSETDSDDDSDGGSEAVSEHCPEANPVGGRYGFTPNGSPAQIAAHRAGRRDWIFAR